VDLCLDGFAFSSLVHSAESDKFVLPFAKAQILKMVKNIPIPSPKPTSCFLFSIRGPSLPIALANPKNKTKMFWNPIYMPMPTLCGCQPLDAIIDQCAQLGQQRR
jgi:hypothetical protein